MTLRPILESDHPARIQDPQICYECGGSQIVYRGRFNYGPMCRLDNIWLEDIDLLRCPQCNDISPVLFALSSLHRTIAESILRDTKHVLFGKKLKFIRKWMAAHEESEPKWFVVEH